MGNPSRPGGPKLGLRQGLVETGSEGKTRKHGGSTPRDARRWQTRCAGAGFGVMPDGGKTRALGTAYRRRRRLPSDTLIELDVGLGLAEEVPVRHRLGSILPGGRPAGGANGGGREGSPSWVKVRSMGAASMSNAALVLASTGRERPVASAGIPGSRQVEAACGRSPRSVRFLEAPPDRYRRGQGLQTVLCSLPRGRPRASDSTPRYQQSRSVRVARFGRSPVT